VGGVLVPSREGSVVTTLPTISISRWTPAVTWWPVAVSCHHCVLSVPWG